MKLISELNEKPVTLKEILLRKKTSEAITTEQFLEVMPQPEDTCPTIEDLLTELEGINKTFLEIEKLLDVPHEKLPPLQCCKNDEFFMDNLRNLDAFKLALFDISQTMPEIEQLIESVRRSCEEERLTGTLIKELIWARLSGDDELVEVPKTLRLAPKKTELIEAFESLELSLPLFKIEHCECENHEKNEMLSQVAEEVESFLDTIYVPRQIEEIFNNLDLIKNWKKSLASKFKSVSKSFNLDEEKEVYLSRLNLTQKDRFEAWVLNLKPLRNVSGKNALNNLTSNTENMIRTKEISLSIDLYNSFVHKFNFELLTKFDSIPISEILDEAEEVRAFFYPIKEEETREVRNIIIQVLTHLISKIKQEGRQTFKIQ